MTRWTRICAWFVDLIDIYVANDGWNSVDSERMIFPGKWNSVSEKKHDVTSAFLKMFDWYKWRRAISGLICWPWGEACLCVCLCVCVCVCVCHSLLFEHNLADFYETWTTWSSKEKALFVWRYSFNVFYLL